MDRPFRRTFYWCIAGLFGLAALVWGNVANADLILETGVCYGKGGDTDLLLDLARPAGASVPGPGIIFVHGGGWYTGNREQYRNEIRTAAERGYFAATVTYRLTNSESQQPENRFPAQIEDVKCAIRWLRSNAAKYNVDPNRIGIKGASAGGHLSLLAGVTDQSHGLEGSGGLPDVSSRVQAVVNYYGPTDLPILHQANTKAAPMLEQLLGGTPQTVPKQFELGSPITYLSSDDPPMLTIHGGKDPLVPIDQAKRFDERAKEVGASHELLVLPEQEHGFSGEDRKLALEASFRFFDRHLNTARPNIVLMMADDLGWGDTGYNGHPTIQTPHLDEMSREGLRMNRFYAASPVCSPTRGSCLTGRHALRYGIRTANDGTLKDQEICLAELLSDRGYATGHFGKWHLGTLTTTSTDSNRGRPGNVADFAPPWRHGFQTCFSTEALMPTWWETGEYSRHTSRYWTGPDTSADPTTIHGDDSRVLMDRATAFVESSVHQSRPFFAVVWFHAPHQPVVGGPDDRARYSNSTDDQQHYFAAVTALDEQVGRLRKTLKTLGVEKNTMVWFCSDNGPEGNPGPQKRSQGTAAIFRGRKRSLYEGGIRVPGLLVWPDRIPAPRETSVPCVTSDYFPTVLEALGIPLPDKRPYDGISLMPLINGQTEQRKRPIAFQFETQSALSGDRFKLVHNLEPRRLASDNGTTPTTEWELYDLIEDPRETKNLAMERPDVVKEMQSALLEWQTSCKASNAGNDYP